MFILIVIHWKRCERGDEVNEKKMLQKKTTTDMNDLVLVRSTQTKYQITACNYGFIYCGILRPTKIRIMLTMFKKMSHNSHCVTSLQATQTFRSK